jgi:scyllo-inositol 2-dehydrogenase (NADP+)
MAFERRANRAGTGLTMHDAPAGTSADAAAPGLDDAARPALQVMIVGWGGAARTWHRPLIEATSGLVLSGAVSSRPGAVAADCPDVPVWPDLTSALAQTAPDLVVLATPPDTHALQAAQALEAGCHVLVEKPFTARLDEALDLLRRAQAARRVLAVFHNRRWDGDFLTVRRLIAEGRLGPLVRVDSRMDRWRPTVRARWRERDGAGGGLWWDLGPHLLDQALVLFGWPDTLRLDLACQRQGACTDDAFEAVLGYGPLRVHLGAHCLAAHPTPRFLVQGRLAGWSKVGVDPQEDALKAGDRPGGLGWGLDPVGGRLVRWVDGAPLEQSLFQERGQIHRFYAALRDAILGRGPVPVPAGEAAAAVALLELGVRSAREGRTLPVRASLAATGLFDAPGVPQPLSAARSVH